APRFDVVVAAIVCLSDLANVHRVGITEPNGNPERSLIGPGITARHAAFRAFPDASRKSGPLLLRPDFRRILGSAPHPPMDVMRPTSPIPRWEAERMRRSKLSLVLSQNLSRGRKRHHR